MLTVFDLSSTVMVAHDQVVLGGEHLARHMQQGQVSEELEWNQSAKGSIQCARVGGDSRCHTH